MANSAVVGSLKVILGLDSAEYDSGMKQVSASAKAWSKDLGRMGQQATALGRSMTTMLTLPIVAAFGGATKAAMDFESSFANVSKTVEGSDTELAALAVNLRNMAKEIPLTTDELNKIAALGGQMGVPISALEKFTSNVAALGVAVDGISTEEAAAGLAQIGNIAGTGTSQIAEMSSALVHLGNKSNATEADILEFTKRLMGAGSAIGLSVPEVMALGTAMANVGVNAEAGGTAMSTVMTKISVAVSKGGSSLAEFARVADMSAEAFAEKFRTSPIQAIDAFIQGLARMKGEGTDLNLLMGDLGTEGIRVADVLKRLSGSADGVSTSLEIANEGFSAGNKHLEEAEKKYATTANQAVLLWSAVKDLGITLGNALLPALQTITEWLGKLLPIAESMASAFGALPGPVQAIAIGLAALVAAAGPLLMIFGSMATGASALAAAFTTTGIATTALNAVIPVLGTVLTALTGPIGIVLAAITGLAAAWYFFGDDVTEAVTATYKAVKEWLWDKLKPVIEPLIPLLDSIGAMFEAFGMLVGAVVEKVYRATESWIGQKLVAVFNGMMAAVKFVVDGIGKLLGMIPDHLLPLLGPIGAVVLAFRKWDEITKIAKAVYDGVKTYLIDKFTDIVAGVKAKVDAVTGYFKGMYDQVVGNSFVPDMIEGIRAQFARLPEVMENPAQGATATVTSMFDSMRGGVVGIVGGLTADITGKFGALSGLLEGPLSDVKAFVDSQFGEMATVAVGRVGQMFEDITGKFTGWGGQLEGLINTHIGGPLGKGMGNLASSLVGSFSSILTGGLTSLFAMAMPFVVGGMAKLGQVIWDGLKKFGSWIGGLFKGEGAKTNDVRDDLKLRLGGDASGAGLDEKLTPFLGDPEIAAAYETFNTTGNRDDLLAAAEILQGALVPSFAMGSGGFMDFGAGTLAMLHGREAVIPEAAVMDANAMGGEMRIVIQQDGRNTAEWLLPFIPGAARRLGLAGVY